VVADGDWYLVECAVRADGVTSPVSSFLDELGEAAWAPGVGEPFDQDAQVRTRSWFLAACEQFAHTGDLPRCDYNRLRDGIWEFKHFDFRVSFFDTDGTGAYTPKLSERMPFAGGGYCPLPNFDEYIRLGHPFPKMSAKTSQTDLNTAATVRREDLRHDIEG